MEKITLKVKPRNPGKHQTKAVRREGKIPGVFYTSGNQAVHFLVESKAMKPIVYTVETKMIELLVDGDPSPKACLLKDISFHPVTEKILHFDLVGIRDDKKMSVEIPIVLKGQSIGVREGGILQHSLHKIHVHCFPQYIPNHIEIDITNLKIGKTVYLKDIKPENVEFTVHTDMAVVSVLSSRLKAEAAKQAAAGTPTAAAPAKTGK